MKTGLVDYVRLMTNSAKFGPFWISGQAPARGEIYGWCDFFLLIDTPTDQTRQTR